MLKTEHREKMYVGLCLIVLLAAFVDLAVVERQGLWVDEVSSLARATGHSLEHPAEEAVPNLGDFWEPSNAVDPKVFREYMRHDDPPASLSRVLRSVMISDTNPPFYYVLLHFWTRVLGTSDFSLRLLSIVFGLLCVPVLWFLGRQWTGGRTAVYAVFFFALAPMTVYYSVEGRMYSLVWLESLLFVFFTLRLQREGWSFGSAVILVTSGVMGLLTHYYFVFLWLPVGFWILTRPGKLRRGVWSILLLSTIGLTLPWYIHVPETFAGWRVTGEWLREPLPWKQALAVPLISAWRLVSPYVLGKEQRLIDLLISSSLVLAFLWNVMDARRTTGGFRAGFRSILRSSFSGDRIWPWIWFFAVCLGPSLQDLLLQTSAASERRYVLGAVPVAQLLIAYWLANLRTIPRSICLILLIGGYLTGIYALYDAPVREQRHFRELGKELSAQTDPGDLIIVHSIPQGVLGLARYMTQSVPMTSWVGQLRQRRVPQDIERLVKGHQRVYLLKIHDLGEPTPEEDWLRKNAELVKERKARGYRLLIFGTNPQREDNARSINVLSESLVGQVHSGEWTFDSGVEVRSPVAWEIGIPARTDANTGFNSTQYKTGRCGGGVQTPGLWRLALEAELPLPASAKPGFILERNSLRNAKDFRISGAG